MRLSISSEVLTFITNLRFCKSCNNNFCYRHKNWNFMGRGSSITSTPLHNWYLFNQFRKDERQCRPRRRLNTKPKTWRNGSKYFVKRHIYKNYNNNSFFWRYEAWNLVREWNLVDFKDFNNQLLFILLTPWKRKVNLPEILSPNVTPWRFCEFGIIISDTFC